ncbi:hypothetical protein AB9K35_17085 [Leisingera sp. XS_AS12]|uniref:hypothetical protein n=1 Tax=Leisingera sp. XS_AS12 TaxID=3241294 RepID=UPI0035152777
MTIEHEGLTQEQVDERAVARFAEEMRRKLARSRAKGRDGWQDPKLCPIERLASMFAGHLGKTNEGNLVDLATLAMMLHERGAHPVTLLRTLSLPEPVFVSEEERISWDDGTSVPVDPVWVLDIDGIRLEVANEAKARSVASAINARSQKPLDTAALKRLAEALRPLAEFMDIPGASCAPHDAVISKSLEGGRGPALTFGDARRAQDAIAAGEAHIDVSEVPSKGDAYSAAAAGTAFAGLRKELEGLPPGAARDQALAAADRAQARVLEDVDVPGAFRRTFAANCSRRDASVCETGIAPDRTELIRAMEPFARLGVGEDGGDIVLSLMGERIKDWLGVRDFQAIRRVFAEVSGDKLPDPIAACEPESAEP